ncbi:procathepsin L-like isoform X2 [Sitodiplosis mosellana]|uniref:procathepsin L-like isoform X2 n=1 Tax=Sitodiplosis mosellana TaxID=263140 RepID=UPI0024442966|nr:procathepsin L-like isoform X2 [Sitodiplosis mosellana]
MANKRISCVLLVGLLTVISNSIGKESLDDEWESFKSEHSKSYESETEEVYRKSIFIANKILIDQHNNLYYDGEISYEVALNAYSDLTDSEFSSQMKGYKHHSGRNKRYYSRGARTQFTGSSNATIPEHVDWRDKGAVTEVKDQNPCGSCWAFAATGALESQHFIKTGKLVPFSEQNLIDCSQSYGNEGCNGGWVDSAYKYIKDNVGINLEGCYPYEAKDNVCRYNPKSSATTIDGYMVIPEGLAFRHLSRGIYTNENCSLLNLDHAVLAVGYGTDENGQDYYIVKNSWGESWGNNGYIKMARNKNNHCGIASVGIYPLV